MRILHVVDKIDPKLGGVSQAVRTMIGGLNKLSCKNEIVCLDSPGAPFISSDLNYVHALGPGKTPWSYNEKLIPWFLTNLTRFDIIILHGLWLYIGFGLYKAYRKADKSSVESIPRIYIMPHGMLDPYFQRASGRRLKALRNLIYWRIIENKIVNEANGLLFTCEEECLLAREYFRPYIPKREIISGLGVEEPPSYTYQMDMALKEICPALSNEPFILFLSRINEKKGVDILIEAYNLFYIQAQTFGNRIPRLLIAGPGLDTPYGKKILARVDSLSLNKEIIFSDMITGLAKWGAFYKCDVFILPSHQENFGIAVVEALSCMKMVLISDNVNIWREIEKHEAGLIFKNSIQGTKKALENWYELSEKEKSSNEVNARDLFLKKFNISTSAKNLLSQL